MKSSNNPFFSVKETYTQRVMNMEKEHILGRLKLEIVLIQRHISKLEKEIANETNTERLDKLKEELQFHRDDVKNWIGIIEWVEAH